MERWLVEQVMAIAPRPGAIELAEPLTDPALWLASGSDQQVVWGRCRGSGREPYDVAVDHVHVAWRCSCPSRVRPCKHALALLLRWARGDVVEAVPPPEVGRWAASRAATAAAVATPDRADRHRPDERAGGTDGGADGSPAGHGAGDRHDERARGRDERVARMRAGLIELDRWLEDRLRTGLADPAVARYSTWDDLAARLVDARAGALANRVRRVAGLVGASPDWHHRVLTEIGLLHLVVRAGLRLPDLPGPLADAVATATGWQVRHADVLAGVPETDRWVVAGRSDTREDRIEVRRTWLWATTSQRWAMVLSFAAYGQGLDESLVVGECVEADVFWYPGGSLRALVGDRHGMPSTGTPTPCSVAAACDHVGRAVAAEPWLERLAVTVVASPTTIDGRWVLTDPTGTLPLCGDDAAVATLLAASLGHELAVTVEWTSDGVLPLTVHLADRSLDVGPRADPSFVGTAR